MKLLKNTKKGTYIVEAVIIIPVFIVAVVMLMSIVPIIGTCENITYATADEMNLENVKSAFRKNPGALPISLKHRIDKENDQIKSFYLKEYRYLFTDKGIEDLISLKFNVVFSKKNPMGLFTSVIYQGQVLSRAFTGTLRKEAPASEDDFDQKEESCLVYIFPEWGSKYHGKNCTYIQSNCMLSFLSQDMKSMYSPCHLCDAKSTEIGMPVFYFTVSGHVYHVADCRTIDKYYIETEKKDAEAKGYSPCSKCGGV